MTGLAPLPQSVPPPGIRSRFVEDVNGLRMHILEAGFEARSEKSGAHPLILLLRGFPELAYSWRKVMLPLAAAGFHVVAPDQRGYGRTTGWDGNYDGDVASFRTLNLVRDVTGLVSALGYRSVTAVVGHDAGSSVAAWASLIRPDVFRSVAMMSAPFAGPPVLPFNTDYEGLAKPPASSIHDDLAALKRPRKHYQWYYSTREANDNMWKCRQGVHAFMRAYYHHKSADWKQNRPFPLESWTAGELEKMPTYYIMDLREGMAESPGTPGCLTTSWRCTRKSMAATDFRAGSSGTAATPAAGTPPNFRSSPAAPSTCRLASSRERATGESTSAPAAT